MGLKIMVAYSYLNIFGVINLSYWGELCGMMVGYFLEAGKR
jgi:hypothetical protein